MELTIHFYGDFVGDFAGWQGNLIADVAIFDKSSAETLKMFLDLGAVFTLNGRELSEREVTQMIELAHDY